jgi:hypothetical protein
MPNSHETQPPLGLPSPSTLGLTLHEGSINPTSLDTLLACPRKYYLRDRLRLRPEGWLSKALLIGRFYHTGRAALLEGKNPQVACLAIGEESNSLGLDLQAKADPDTNLLTTGQDCAYAISEIDRASEVASAMTSFSATCFPWPPTVGNWWLSQIEKSIEEGSYKIRLDALAVIEGEFWIVEHKTEGRSVEDAERVYRFSYQPRLYAKILRELTGYSVAGVILDIIAKPTIKLKRNQEWQDYIDEIAEWYTGTGRHSSKEEDRKLHPPFKRSWVRIPNEHDSELHGVLGKLEVARKCTEPNSHFPRNPSNCRRDGSVCPYLPLCESDPAKWPDIIATKFTPRTKDKETGQ